MKETEFKDFKLRIDPEQLIEFNEWVDFSYPEIIENILVDAKSRRKSDRKPQETISGTLESVRKRLGGNGR